MKNTGYNMKKMSFIQMKGLLRDNLCKNKLGV